MPLETLHDERGKALDNTHYAPNHRKWKGTFNNYVNVFNNSATFGSQECWEISKLTRTNRRGEAEEPQMLLTPCRNVFETFNFSLKRFGKFLTCCQNLFRRCWHLVEGGADEGVVRGAAEAEVGGRVRGVQVPVMISFTIIWFFRSLFRSLDSFQLFLLNSRVM